MKAIGEKHGKTAAQVAINWVISKGAIPLVGVKNSKQVIFVIPTEIYDKQLEENLGALGWRLNEEEVKQLDGLSLTGGWSMWQESS